MVLYFYNYPHKNTTRYPISLDEGEICATFVREDLLYAIHSSGLIDIINIRKNQLVGTINNFMTTADNIHSLNLFVDSTSSQTVPVRIQFNHSLNLFVDSTGECWVYMNPQTYSGLFRYSPTNKRWTHYTTTSTPLLSSNLVRGIIENTDGNIWIATDHGGINVLDKRQNTIRYLKNDPYDPQSLSQNSIISIYRDTSDIIWCGTYKNGINYYHESIFKFNTLKYPLHNTYDTSINDYNCVIEDAEGNLWIGTNGSGLIHYNRKNNQFRQYKHDDKDPNSLSSDIIICLQRDANGHLWIGTYLGGLNRFDGKQFKQYKPADQTLSNSIYSMYVDEDNHLWVGTLDNGLYCMDLKNNEWQTIETDNLTSFVMQETVYAISRGIHANELFIGTSAGISTINRWTRHISPFNPSGRTVSLSGNKSINTILTDSRNLVWIGTNSGIVIHDSVHNKEYNLTIRNGLPSNSIMSIIEDLSHTIWIGSKNGLLKIVPTYHDDTDRYSFDVSTHYENEGVQDRVFNRNCVSYTSKGEILMGGINGLTVFNPLRLLYNDIPSTPIITTLLIHNRHKDQSGEFESERLDVSYEEHVDLTYNERSITIGMAAFTYILPETTTFQFYLQGFDKDWETIQSRNGRYITYTNLPAGKYTFFVKAYDANATHNQSVASLGITIHPPFWYTNWAIVIYILILMLVAYVIIHSLTSIQQRKLAHKYVELQTMHTHEMDETRLQFFTNISHELRTPLTLIMAPLDQLIKEENNPIHKNLLNVIHNNAERLLMLVNQLLDFRKINTGNALLLLSSGDIVSFVRNIVYSFKNVAEKRHLKLLFSCHFSSLLIGFDTDKVFKIISNLINNAIKFTPDNGQIAITISLERRENDSYWIVIDVTDTGIGIESNQAELIFQRFYQVQTPPDQLTPVGTGIGLHISRELAQLHGGTLTLTKSEPGVGSTFTFAFPTQLYKINEVVTTDKEEATSVQAETSIGPFN
ncbi:MAG: hybrid sensor histidine kinase/response regulator, partial [Prevotellaceae bacterium]|nr:hybrid sensor histidine kinase/response regulator [Prevotellaceae bacterium]